MTAPFSGINVPQPGQSLQRARRLWRIFTDQHGRRFGAQADALTNSPIGEFQPQSEKGFVIAPWYPTMYYAKFAQTGDLDFRWDYAGLADEWSSMTAAYYEEAVKRALELPGDVPVPEVGGIVDRRVRASLGPVPRSPAIPMACELGDPWILGQLGAPVNEELKALLAQQDGANGQEALRAIRARLEARAATSGVVPVVAAPPKVVVEERVRSITDLDDAAPLTDITWQQFLSAAKKRGVLSDAEISVAWAEFKKDRDAQKKEAA